MAIGDLGVLGLLAALHAVEGPNKGQEAVITLHQAMEDPTVLVEAVETKLVTRRLARQLVRDFILYYILLIIYYWPLSSRDFKNTT
jgi:hypothetical protein